MREASLDLRYNIAALTIAICHNQFLLPEQAFSIISDKTHRTTVEDKEDMLRLKEQGLSFNKIGKVYGVTGSNVYKVLNKYKVKKETSLAGTRKGQE